MFGLYNNLEASLDGLPGSAFDTPDAFLNTVWPGIASDLSTAGHIKLVVCIEAQDKSQRELVMMRTSEAQLLRAVEATYLAGGWVQQAYDWSSTPCRVYLTVTADMLRPALGWAFFRSTGMYEGQVLIDRPDMQIDLTPYQSPDPFYLMLSPDATYPGDQIHLTLSRFSDPVQIGGTAGRWKMADGSAVVWPQLGNGQVRLLHIDAWLDRVNCCAYIKHMIAVPA
ncbi:hypothetical protein [uncultured Aquitalea sp.]|uniref:hypothetical protein n=1 Tax=uncultured Aquitalea sp. TaxID=540272 RepID=UPI0025D7792A|nr:hypothetical protein [uncultured Aquitalea sp.]